MKKTKKTYSIYSIIISRLLTLVFAFTFTFENCGKAYAADATKEGQAEEKSFGQKFGDAAKEAGKQAAIDAAKSIAVGVATSVARQAAEAASSFGAGAAIGAAKKAAVAAKQAASYAKAVKGAAELQGFAKKSVQTLIVAIVFGLVGITAIFSCKKKGNSTPAPSFYLWTIGSIVFMISEIVHFIKFKSISKKLGNQQLVLENKQQLEALKQQRDLMREALKTAKGKKTWTQILNAAFIASGVAALAELAIEILTEGMEVTFNMKCGKDDGKDEDGKESGEGKEGAAESSGEAAAGDKKIDFNQALKEGGQAGLDSIKNSGNNAINTMSSTVSSEVGGTLGKKGADLVMGKKEEDKEETSAESEESESPREPSSKDLTESDEEETLSEDDGTNETEIEEEEEEYNKFSFFNRNKLFISDSAFGDYKKVFLSEINSHLMILHYAGKTNDTLVKDIMDSKTDLDSYFVFDEWHRARHGEIKSVSIDKYDLMNKHDLINGMFQKEEKGDLGLKDILALSLQFIKSNVMISHAIAKGGGGGGKVGKALGNMAIEILAGIAENAVTSMGTTIIERHQEKEENKLEEKYAEKEKELEKEQEKLDAEIEKEREELELYDEKIAALESRKEEIATEREEAEAEKEEEEAEESDEEESDEEEEEEEEFKIFYLEEEENEFDEEKFLEQHEGKNEAELQAEIDRLREEHEGREAEVDQKESSNNTDAQAEQLARQQEEEERKRESGVEGMIRGKGYELAENGVDEAGSFVGDGIRGLANKKDKNTEGGGTDGAGASGTAPDGSAGPQDGVKTATNKDKFSLKGKIKELWGKLMDVYTKLFGSAPTRSALSAATVLMVNLWILKEIKKQIKLTEDNLKELDKLIAELEAQETLAKKDTRFGSGKKDLESDKYRPDMSSAAAAMGAGYQGAMSSKFAGMNGICLKGQGSNMQLSGCGCAATNSCTRFDQHKVDSKYFPSAVAFGQNSVYGMAHKMTNGDYKGATLSGMEFAKNATSMLKKRNQMRAKINDMLKSKGMAPMNFTKNAAQVLSKTFEAADISGVAEAYDKVHGAGRKRGTASELSKSETKQEYMDLSSELPAKTEKAKSVKAKNYFDLAKESPEREVAQEKVAALEEYDVAIEDIQDRPNTSIFDIIHVRYIKSGYPVLLQESKVKGQ